MPTQKITALSQINPTPREILQAARTYYVRTDGNDSNTGLIDSASGAFLTIQKAVDVACSLDNNGFSITIQIRGGTYTSGVTLHSYIGSYAPTIVGDTSTPARVVISTTNADCISTDRFCGSWNIGGLKLQTSGSGNCISAYLGSYLLINQKVEFGSCAGFHVLSAGGGYIQITTPYTISGGATYHVFAQGGGYIYGSSLTVTATGTIVFNTFAVATFVGRLENAGSTFTGIVSGTRYYGDLNAVIFTGGGGASYFPGTAAGALTNGAQYA